MATNTGTLLETDQDSVDDDAPTSTPTKEAAEAEGGAGSTVRFIVEPNGQTPVGHTVIRLQNDDPRLHWECGNLHPGTI
jgi:hypothetical protein